MADYTEALSELSGDDYLTLDTTQQMSDSTDLTVVIYGEIANHTSTTYLLHVWGRHEIRAFSTSSGKLSIRLKNTSNTTIVEWSSDNDFFPMSAPGLLYIHADTSSPAALTVNLDGSAVSGSTSTLTDGTLDNTRDEYGIFAEHDGINPLQGESVGYIYVADHHEAESSFWSGGKAQSPPTNGEFVYTSEDNFALNKGSGDDFTRSGTFPHIATNQTITGAVYANSNSFGAGTVSTDYEITGAVYNDTDTIHAGTVSASYDITGAVYNDTDSFGAGTVGATYEITGAVYADPDSFGSGAISTGGVSQTITGAAFTNSSLVQAGTISATYTITGVAYSDSDLFGSGTASAAYTITGAVYADSDAFGAGTIAETYNITGAVYADPDTFYSGTIGSGDPQSVTGAHFFNNITFHQGQVVNSFVLLPEPLVGFGAGATGGRGGSIYEVTSLSNGTGSGTIRDAISEPNRYIVLKVEGRIYLDGKLEIQQPNITIDGRWAPGNGCWFAGDRIEVEHSNIIFEDVSHLGNENVANGESDNMRIGDYNGSRDIEDIYLRRCAFMHGQDECLAYTMRGNGASSGRRCDNSTVDRCIMALPSGANHEFTTFVGDGMFGLTIWRSLYSGSKFRTPFVREYVERVEQVNCLIYNSGNRTTENISQNFHLIKCDFKKGPVTTGSSYQGARNYSGAVTYETGCIVSNGSGIVRGPEPTWASSPLFTGSGVAEVDASEVEDLVVGDVGPRNYNGVRNSVIQNVIDDAIAGNAPGSYQSHPGTEPSTTGATFPASTGNGVPNAYLQQYPNDTDPALMISGGAWDGYMVAERIGAWLVASESTPEQEGIFGTLYEDPDSFGAGIVTGGLQATRIEAEDFTLVTNYSIQAIATASNGNVIRVGDGEAGNATYTWTGATDTYDIRVAYYDESDGNSTMNFKVATVTVDTWTWDANPGGALADPTTLVIRTIPGITVNNGDVLELDGQADGGEPLRVDYIELLSATTALVINGVSYTNASTFGAGTLLSDQEITGARYDDSADSFGTGVVTGGAGSDPTFVKGLTLSVSINGAVMITSSSDHAAGDILLFAVATRGTDTDPAIDTGASVYTPANLSDLGVVKPLSTSQQIKMRIYSYEIPDSSTFTFEGLQDGTDLLGISGIIYRGAVKPTALLDSTNGVDHSGTAISIPSTGAVTINNLVVGVLVHRFDTNANVVQNDGFSGTNVTNMTVRNGAHSSVNVGMGLYWPEGRIAGTSIGPLTATANQDGPWQTASIELGVAQTDINVGTTLEGLTLATHQATVDYTQVIVPPSQNLYPKDNQMKATVTSGTHRSTVRKIPPHLAVVRDDNHRADGENE